ncbi:MAG: TolC family protein [Planktomarina sp.]|nr:TolC family protein [Planktomarina sp.]
MECLNILLLGTAISFVLVACEQRPKEIFAVQAFSDEAVKARIPIDINLSSGKLTLNDFVRLLSVSDESIRAQDIEIVLAQQNALGAWGIFEAQVYGSIDRNSELSQSSAAEALTQGSGTDSEGDPNPYASLATKARVGLEGKNPSGVKMDLFYQVESLRNSVQSTAGTASPELTSVLGASLTVPILRNAGTKYNKAPIEIARIDEKIASETSRLVKSQRAFDAIKTYLMVQRAQSRVEWRRKAYDTANALEQEMAAQVSAGLRSSAELKEASAKVSQQVSSLNEARQELNEQIGAFQIFFVALKGDLQKNLWMPSDSLLSPSGELVDPRYLTSVDEAVILRTETRINALRIEREEIGILMAENQAKPEINLQLDTEKTYLSDTYTPFRDVFSHKNPYRTWRVGFEYRRGVLGNITKKKELEAAKLREKQAELTMNAFSQRIASEINGIKSILDRANDQLAEQSKMVDTYRDLYLGEKQKSANGQSSKLEVLNRELTYYLAIEGQQEAIAQQNLSSYLASKVTGTLLSRMGVE